MGPDWQNKGSRPVDVLDRGTLIVILGILSLIGDGSGLAKRKRSYVWVSEQRLVNQTNTIRRKLDD